MNFKKIGAWLLGVLVLVVVTAGLGWMYFMYGSIFSICIYTEKEIPIPKELLDGKIMFTKDIRQAIGKGHDYGCLSKLGKVTRELLPPDEINRKNIDLSLSYQGSVLQEIPTGTKIFHVVKIFEVTKRGISTIDSGSRPIYFLVLADEVGDQYWIATVSLYENGGIGDRDIAELRIDSNIYHFNRDSFQEYDPRTAKLYFKFRLEPKK